MALPQVTSFFTWNQIANFIIAFENAKENFLVVLKQERLPDNIKQRKQLTKSEQICIFKWLRQTAYRTHHGTQRQGFVMFREQAAGALINFIKQKDHCYVWFHGHKNIWHPPWLSILLCLFECCTCHAKVINSFFCLWNLPSTFSMCSRSSCRKRRWFWVKLFWLKKKNM